MRLGPTWWIKLKGQVSSNPLFSNELPVKYSTLSVGWSISIYTVIPRHEVLTHLSSLRPPPTGQRAAWPQLERLWAGSLLLSWKKMRIPHCCKAMLTMSIPPPLVVGFQKFTVFTSSYALQSKKVCFFPGNRGSPLSPGRPTEPLALRSRSSIPFVLRSCQFAIIFSGEGRVSCNVLARWNLMFKRIFFHDKCIILIDFVQESRPRKLAKAIYSWVNPFVALSCWTLKPQVTEKKVITWDVFRCLQPSPRRIAKYFQCSRECFV